MSATATQSGTTRFIKLETTKDEMEEQLFNYYLTAYGVIMRRFISEDIIPTQQEVFRLGRIQKCEEVLPDGDHKQAMIKYFKNYQVHIPSLTLKDFESYECPIVRKMSRWVDEFVLDVSEIIKKDLALNYIEKEDGELTVNANVKKIKEFCLTYIEGEKNGKYDPMADYIHEYIHKQEEICVKQFKRDYERLTAVMEDTYDVVEEKVVSKSKSQLKKEKAREANKRRDQEKAEKIKRQEKEAKYLEQKHKEAEKKRIAVCRAKNRK
jgi:hypothetical protein